MSTTKSWALQGQTFYSGQTEYRWKAELPEVGEYQLCVPRGRDVVGLYIDGLHCGEITRAPYTFTFSATGGEHEFALRVVNSLGNQMECYAEESGILAGGHIEIIDK